MLFSGFNLFKIVIMKAYRSASKMRKRRQFRLNKMLQECAAEIDEHAAKSNS
jgi:hypothetical protein